MGKIHGGKKIKQKVNVKSILQLHTHYKKAETNIEKK